MTTHGRLGSTFLRPRNPRKYLVDSSFKAQVENLSGKRIKILRLDNGGEYTSTEFNDFCKEARIKRELTVPYNPQRNGVVERKNRQL